MEDDISRHLVHLEVERRLAPRTLAMYGLHSGPLGYRPLREFIARKLAKDAGITCTADEVLITSGSLPIPIRPIMGMIGNRTARRYVSMRPSQKIGMETPSSAITIEP